MLSVIEFIAAFISAFSARSAVIFSLYKKTLLTKLPINSIAALLMRSVIALISSLRSPRPPR